MKKEIVQTKEIVETMKKEILATMKKEIIEK